MPWRSVTPSTMETNLEAVAPAPSLLARRHSLFSYSACALAAQRPDRTWAPKDPTADVTIAPSIPTASLSPVEPTNLSVKTISPPTSSTSCLPTDLYLSRWNSGAATKQSSPRPGSQPFADPSVDVTSGGTGLAQTDRRHDKPRGTLTLPLSGQPTQLPGRGYSILSHPAPFYDASGNALPVSGTGPYTVNGKPVYFYASNPVGTTVATVDLNTGLVTMGSGFYARGLITAWCDGVTTTAKLVSTNGSGKYPVQPPHSFAINPTTLHFYAKQGGANPPDQTYDIMPLSSNFKNYNYTTHYSWISETPTNVNNYNIMDVSVNTTGLGPGTYSLPLIITDSASHFSQTITVTLTITPAPPATLYSGTYVGNWTYPARRFRR